MKVKQSSNMENMTKSPVSEPSASAGSFGAITPDNATDSYLKPPGKNKKGPGPAETGRLKKPRSRTASTSSSASNIAQVRIYNVPQ